MQSGIPILADDGTILGAAGFSWTDDVVMEELAERTLISFRSVLGVADANRANRLSSELDGTS